MTGLVEFLRARLTEDEMAAHQAGQYSGLRDRGLVEGWELARFGEELRRLKVQTTYGTLPPKLVTTFDDALFDRPIAAHIARHNPARVLREVEAKRGIIERHEQAREFGGKSTISAHVNAQDDGYVQACFDALRDLALPYADHPDYREEWRP